MILLTLSPAQHRITEEVLIPNNFLYEHRLLLINQLSTSLVLPCLVRQSTKLRCLGRADPDEAAPVPRPGVDKIEEIKQHHSVFYALSEVNRMRTRHSGGFVGVSTGLDFVFPKFVEQAPKHQWGTQLVEREPSMVLVVRCVGEEGFFGQTMLDGENGDEYHR